MADINEEVSTEELEKRLLELKEELGSDGGSSESSSQEDNSDEEKEQVEECRDKEEEEEEMGCPAKRMKLEDSSDDEEEPIDAADANERAAQASDGMNTSQPKDGEPVAQMKRQKRIPEYPMGDVVLPLPEGWIDTLHDSGVPIYMHKATRVVTLSRPYTLPESLRRHSIPLASVPCVQQRKMAEHRANSARKLNGAEGEIIVPQAQIKTQLREERLTPDEMFDISKERFFIKEIMVYKKADWKTIRAHKKAESFEKAMQDTTTIDMDVPNTMITVAAGCGAQGKKIKKRGYILNVVGKTSVALLNEYVQKVLKGSLEHKVDDVKSSINPYSCVYYLKKENDKTVIGRGNGNSKNIAKLNAASASLKNLIPGLNIDENNYVRGNISDKESVEAFDLLQIDDPKVVEYSKKTGKPLPHSVLMECIRMNVAWGATRPEESSERLAHHKYKLTLKVGRHETTVECASLKDGRQRAAQCLLKLLYPAMETWGSIIRLFSSSANEDLVESRKVREKIVRLAPQLNGREYVRNEAVLGALRSEMARVATLLEGRVERKKGLQNSELQVIEENKEGGEGEKSLVTPHSINL